jgi:hypothetical protein
MKRIFIIIIILLIPAAGFARSRWNELSRSSVESIVYEPSQTWTVTSGSGLTTDMSSALTKVTGSGATDITANPQVANGEDGQVVIFQGTSDSNTVQFDDGDGLELNAGASATLGNGDVLALIYSADSGSWYELFRSNN